MSGTTSTAERYRRLTAENERLKADLAELQERHDVLLDEVSHLREGRSSPTFGECCDLLYALVLEHGKDFGTWWVQIADERWSLTMQRENGTTPADKLNRLEADLAKAREELDHCHTYHVDMREAEAERQRARAEEK